MKRKKLFSKIYNVMDVWQNKEHFLQQEHIKHIKKVTDT
jgi:hypothetical protein